MRHDGKQQHPAKRLSYCCCLIPHDSNNASVTKNTNTQVVLRSKHNHTDTTVIAVK